LARFCNTLFFGPDDRKIRNSSLILIRKETSIPELLSEQDAITRTRALFKPHKNKLTDQAIDDYAKIAWFLSRAQDFESALEDISTDLWNSYRSWFYKYEGRMRNIFTHAIREVAEGYGWKYDSKEHVVLTGRIAGDLYEKWSRDGVLFKDQMDLKHGEHSHTFQWLAVCARRLQIGLSWHPTELYKKIFDAMPQNNKTLIVPGFSLDSGVQGPTSKFTCWSWVADCFPRSYATGGQDPGAPSLFSNTYRTPQILMMHLLDTDPGDNFIKNYLRYRYKRRSWMAQDGGYSSVSGGSTAKVIGDLKHGDERRWTLVDPKGGYSADVKFNQFYGMSDYKERKNPGPGVKEYKPVKFHGLDGHLTDPSFMY